MMLWEFKQPSGFPELMSQILLRRQDDEFVPLAIHAGLAHQDSIDKVRESLGLYRVRMTQIIFHSNEYQLANHIAKRLLRSRSNIKSHYIEFDVNTLNLTVNAIENYSMYRAIAGIAFHYAITYFDLTGFEQQFEGIRDFIAGRSSDDTIVKSINNGSLRKQFGTDFAPAPYCHIILCTRKKHRIKAYMAFYVGAELSLPFSEYCIDIGPRPNKLVVFPETSSHCFQYNYGGPDEEGYDGEMRKMAVLEC